MSGGRRKATSDLVSKFQRPSLRQWCGSISADSPALLPPPASSTPPTDSPSDEQERENRVQHDSTGKDAVIALLVVLHRKQLILSHGERRGLMCSPHSVTHQVLLSFHSQHVTPSPTTSHQTPRLAASVSGSSH